MQGDASWRCRDNGGRTASLTCGEPCCHTSPHAPVRRRPEQREKPRLRRGFFVEPMVGFEPTTCRLRIGCSTAELHWPAVRLREAQGASRARWWPGADLNCRHHDFQSCALPTELPGHVAEPTGFEPATFCVTGRYANRYTTAPRRSPEVASWTRLASDRHYTDAACGMSTRRARSARSAATLSRTASTP